MAVEVDNFELEVNLRVWDQAKQLLLQNILLNYGKEGNIPS